MEGGTYLVDFRYWTIIVILCIFFNKISLNIVLKGQNDNKLSIG